MSQKIHETSSFNLSLVQWSYPSLLSEHERRTITQFYTKNIYETVPFNKYLVYLHEPSPLTERNNFLSVLNDARYIYLSCLQKIFFYLYRYRTNTRRGGQNRQRIKKQHCWTGHHAGAVVRVMIENVGLCSLSKHRISTGLPSVPHPGFIGGEAIYRKIEPHTPPHAVSYVSK